MSNFIAIQNSDFVIINNYLKKIANTVAKYFFYSIYSYYSKYFYNNIRTSYKKIVGQKFWG